MPDLSVRPGGRDRDGLRGGRRQLARPTLPQALGLVVPPFPPSQSAGVGRWGREEGESESEGCPRGRKRSPRRREGSVHGVVLGIRTVILVLFP